MWEKIWEEARVGLTPGNKCPGGRNRTVAGSELSSGPGGLRQTVSCGGHRILKVMGAMGGGG